MIEDITADPNAVEPQLAPVPENTPAVLAAENSIPLPDDSASNPWLESQVRHEQALADYRANAVGKVHAAAMDWSTATKGKNIDLSFSPDQNQAKAEVLTTGYLKALNNGQEIPGGDTGEKLFMNAIDEQRFGGRSQGDPVKFAAEIKREGEYIKGQSDIQQDIQMRAYRSAVSQGIDFFDRNKDDYPKWLEEHKDLPNYDASKSADYLEEWNAQRDQARAVTEPFSSQLRLVFNAIKDDSVGGIAQNIYEELTPEQRPRFIEAVATAVRANPIAEQATFFANLQKTITRPAQGVSDATQKGLILYGANQSAAFSNVTGVPDPYASPPDSTKALAPIDFSSDLQNWQQQYSPVTKVGKNWATRTLEEIAYGAPGVIEGIAPALIPGVGPAYLLASGTGSAYSHFRGTFLEAGQDPETASRNAQALAPIAGAVSTVGMMFGAQALKGIPGLDKAITTIADNFGTNAFVRFGVRGAAATAIDAANFRALDFVDPLVQGAAKSLGAPIPGVEFHNAAKTGILDNFADLSLETAASIVPLAIATAFRGYGADNRAKIYATATDTQLAAVGHSPKQIAIIRAAQTKGLSALDAAITESAPLLNSGSPEAKAAQQALVAQTEQAKEVQKSGLLPKFVTTSEGTTVIDPDTGKALGPAGTPEEAHRLAAAHSSAIDGMKGDEVRRLSTMLEGQRQIAASPGEQDTRQEFSPGEKRTTTQQESKSYADSERVQAQLAGEEIAAGGNGEVTRGVIGTSKTEFDQAVRQTVNEYLGGSNVLTLVHEVTHGKLDGLWQSGAMTREQTLQALRAYDTAALRDSATRAGEVLRFLPNVPDSEITDVHLQEASSKFMEAETLRTRKDPSAPGKLLSQPVITDNLRATAKTLAPEAVRKWSAFAKAIRDYFGVTFTRALKIDNALKSGEIDPKVHAEFVSKLMGLEGQDTHDAKALETARDIVRPKGEGASLSLAPMEMIDKLTPEIQKLSKKPEEKARYFERILDMLGKLKRLAADGVLYSAESFDGTAHERALMELDGRRETATDAHDKRLAEIDAKAEVAKQDAREKLLEKFGPEDGKSAEAKKAEREAVRQAEAKVEAARKTDIKASEAKRDKALTKLDVREAKIATKGALSDSRQTTLNALAMMDGLIGSLPAEDRGKIGGYTHLASLKTDAAREKYFNDRIQKIGEVVESRLRKDYGRLMSKLLKRSEPVKGKPGERPAGKADADTQAVMDLARRAIRWNAKTTAAEAAKLRAEVAAGIDSGKMSQEDQVRLTTRANVIEQVGDWNRRFMVTSNEQDRAQRAMDRRLRELGHDIPKKEFEKETRTKISDGADAARRAAAFKMLNELWQGGYAKAKLQAKLDAEERKIRIGDLKQATGKEGTDQAKASMEEQAKGIAQFTKKSKEVMLALYDFPSFMNTVFGEKSEEARKIIDQKRAADYKKLDLNQGTDASVEELFHQMAKRSTSGKVMDRLKLNGSGLDAERIQFELSRRKQDFDSKGKSQEGYGVKLEQLKGEPLRLSQMQAIDLTMMARQEDGMRHFTGHVDENGKPIGDWHITPEQVAAVEAQLSPEARTVRAFLTAEYAREHAQINPLFRKMFGVDLPSNALYSPLSVEPAAGKNAPTPDPLTGFSGEGAGLTPSSFKTRGQSIAKPLFMDAMQKFVVHKRDINHFLSYAEFAKETTALLNGRNLRDSITEKAGPQAAEVMSQYLDYFTKGGKTDSANQIALMKEIGRMTSGAAGAALAGRISVVAIQSTNLITAAYQMPTGSFLYRLGKLTLSPGGWKAWGTALDSPYIQRRLKEMPPVVRALVMGLRSTEPNVMKHTAAEMGKVIGGADALFTAGTYAMIHDYHMTVDGPAKGYKGAELEAFARDQAERLTDEVAQPIGQGSRSLVENTSMNPIMRLGWAFASDQRQKTALMAYRLTSPDRSAAQKAKAVALTFAIGGLIPVMMRAVMRDARDGGTDETFDSKNWSPTKLGLLTLTSPLKGIPFIGDAVEGGIMRSAGQQTPEGNLFRGVDDAGAAAHDIYKTAHGDKEATTEHSLKDAEAILTGMSLFSGNASALASGSHVVRDIFQFIKTAMEAAKN